MSPSSSSSSGHSTCLRPFIFSNLLVVCFLLLFFTFRNPNMELPSFRVYFQSMDLYFRTASECSRWQDWDKSSLESENEAHSVIVLIWTWPFQRKFDTDCADFGINKCYLTDNRNLYNKSDGVFFHHRDIHLEDLPKIQRPCFQKWVWTNMESPANVPPIPFLDDFFNLTCNYRLDANIPVPYGHIVPQNSGDPIFQLPTKNKLVCWIVSNWNERLLRVQYYKKLKDHIKINSYGHAFRQPLSDKNYSNVISSCKFYLAFENSVHKDYITEKVFSPMLLGSVPIVLGPSRDNYQKHIPAGAFIHVNDFASPKELADKLHYLDNHTEEYIKYFEWRKEYKVKKSWFGREHACRTCGYIQEHRRPEMLHNLTKWFWGR